MPRASGSSPLTRGKPAYQAGACYTDGLIPAHAGKTEGTCGLIFRCGAHPRSRGENSNRAFMTSSGWGSSPLTRGKLTIKVSVHCLVGLIPAHAGKTDQTTPKDQPAWAHPRSRGENIHVYRFLITQSGSSPLTRGKPRSLGLSSTRSGLIPAHAGKTDGRRARRPPRPAHPRSRGENARRST